MDEDVIHKNKMSTMQSFVCSHSFSQTIILYYYIMDEKAELLENGFRLQFNFNKMSFTNLYGS